MRPVRGERRGDDAHAVCDMTSPARSVWSLRRFLLPSWSPSVPLRVATEQGLRVEAARAEESGRRRRQVRECLCGSGFSRLCVNGWAVSVRVLRREPRGPHPEPLQP